MATSAAWHIALLPNKKVFMEQKIKSLPPWFWFGPTSTPQCTIHCAENEWACKPTVATSLSPLSCDNLVTPLSVILTFSCLNWSFTCLFRDLKKLEDSLAYWFIKKKLPEQLAFWTYKIFHFAWQQHCMHSRGYSADSNSLSGISLWGHISKRQNTPPLQQASVSPLSFHWHIYCSSQMQLTAREVGRVKHAGAAPWVRMIRSGLEP